MPAKNDYLKRPVCQCGHTSQMHGVHICGAMHCYCKAFKEGK